MSKSGVLTVSLEDLSYKGKNVDILCFCEHNMIMSDINLLNIPNFSLATYYARKNRYGGTCIMVRNDVKFKPIDNILNYSVPNVIECCGIEMFEHNIIVLCIYRPPQSRNAREKFDIFFKFG